MRTSRLGMMTNRCAITIAAAILTATAVGAEQHQAISRGCTEIVGVLEQGAGLSAEEVAKKTSSDVETVRSCTDQWRASQKDPKAPTTGGSATQPVARGCEKIVAVLDGSGGAGLSADEVAKKTGSDVETVRSCTDQWRRSMKSGATP